MLARSPSSAIAIVNELRAHGPFTRTVLGVTMLSDVVVIVLFAVCSSFATAVLAKTQVDFAVVGLVVVEIVLAVVAGILVGRLLPLLGRVPLEMGSKSVLLALAGYLSFQLGDGLTHLSERLFHLELFLEPLLVCMVAGFVVANATGYRAELRRMLDLGGLPVYVVFFTLSGAAVELDTLASTWPIALLLFGARMFAVLIGAWGGGTIAGDPPRLNRVSWLTFLTQAGISLGLAKEVASEFPGWGSSFATLMISVIVLNQFAGPPLFKWALQFAGEVRLRAGRRDLRGTPHCTIFGVDGQAFALARQLEGHGWRVRLVTRREERAAEQPEGEIEIAVVDDHDEESLRAIGAAESHTFVCLLADSDNLRIAAVAYEKLGTRNVVVQSQDRDLWDDYRELGATVVDPGLALVSLLDHFVRSPAVVQLVLGMEQGQDVIDVDVDNPDLHGLAIRDLDLPQDTLVLSVHRDGAPLISHGYTRLERGDQVTVVGSTTSLDVVQRHFAA